MTIQEFHDKAVQGGWKPQKPFSNAEMFLDPKAFQAVGKVEGWDRRHQGYWTPEIPMVQMAKSLASGQSIQDFLSTL